MFKTLLLGLAILMALLGRAQNLTPSQIVEKQLMGYNNKNIDEFMSVFHQDIQLWQLGDSVPVAKGFSNVQQLYANLFKKSPNLHSDVINRTVIGNKVIDYEIITGRNNVTTPLYLVMIYEIKDEKIYRAYSVRQ